MRHFYLLARGVFFNWPRPSFRRILFPHMRLFFLSFFSFFKRLFFRVFLTRRNPVSIPKVEDAVTETAGQPKMSDKPDMALDTCLIVSLEADGRSKALVYLIPYDQNPSIDTLFMLKKQGVVFKQLKSASPHFLMENRFKPIEFPVDPDHQNLFYFAPQLVNFN